MLGWVRAVPVCVPGMFRPAFILFAFGAVEGRRTILAIVSGRSDGDLVVELFYAGIQLIVYEDR